ncbi:hypothetical protein RvY_07250 [Ramazzottius varieornatus]|uniref:cyclin-dependent kinase n=1 Tax=Ramazzottius varieornatus TaxID=947166 RepID=A0A1D1V7L5_RAMVA|nr:hypothetical protein RvY_07250 [Ramazzottius varieornatus]
MSSRQQHPRITVSSSPEQGEMDEEDEYQKERDSQMRRQREEALKREDTRTIQTKYPKNIREQDLREARRRRLESNPDAPERDISGKPFDMPSSSRSKGNAELNPRKDDSESRKHQRSDGSGVATRERRPEVTEGKRRPSPATARLPTDSFATQRPDDRGSSKRHHRSPSPDRGSRAVTASVSVRENHRRKDPSGEPPQRSANGDRSTKRNVDDKQRTRHSMKNSPSGDDCKVRQRSLERRHGEDRRRTSPAKVDKSPSAGSRRKSPSVEEMRRGSKVVDESETLSSDATDSDSGSEVTKGDVRDEEPPFYGPAKLDEEDEDSDNALPEVGPIDEVNRKMEIEPERSLYDDLPPYFPGLDGCRSVDEFECINRIEEGTYGVVYRARDKRTNEVVALKRLKMEKEKEGFPITSLREVSTLLKAHHPNVVTIKEVVVGHNMDKIYMVMEFVEHDLKALMETMRGPFSIGEVKTLMHQLLSAIRHLHDNWIIHRDLKTSNLLLNHRGILKVGDFGLAREYGSPLRPYTPVVVTLWYRAPELLLGIKEYSTPIDVWSCGCIFAELLTLKPLFPGKSEIEQITKIFKELGNPSEANWPGFSELPLVKKTTFLEYPYNVLRKRFPPTVLTKSGYDLLTRLLEYNPKTRITAEEALQDIHFRDVPLPVDPSMFPTWPARSEQTPRGPRNNTPKPPSGGKMYKDISNADDGIDGFRMAQQKTSASSYKNEGFQLRF